MPHPLNDFKAAIAYAQPVLPENFTATLTLTLDCDWVVKFFGSARTA